MKHWTVSWTIIVCGLAALGTWAQDAAPSADEALSKIAAYEFGQSREPLSVVADLVREALASPAATKDMAAKLAALLGTDATRDCKQFVCRQLAVIGGPENVGALAALLTNAATSDMARYALERIPGGQVDAALLAALGEAPVGARVGIINSLGARQCKGAVDTLAGLVGDAKAEIAEAAIAALGKTGGAEALAALDAAVRKVAPELAHPLADARLLCADQFLADGKGAKAAQVYEGLYGVGAPKPVRVAAFKGLVTARGADGVGLVTGVLGGDDAVLRGVAISLVRELPGKGTTKVLVEQLPGMSAEGQVLLLTALADRGDATALPAAVHALDSAEESVRLAGLEALAKLGDASSVLVLAHIAAKSDAAMQTTARASLYSLRGKGVDAAILGNLMQGEAPTRVELILATRERNLGGATPDLLKAAAEPDAAVREAAYAALAALATADELPAVVDLLVKAQDEERGKAEKAVLTVARKAGEAGCPAVLAALSGASASKARVSLLKVLGELGDDAALSALRAGVKDSDAGVQDAAVRALAQWPHTAALEDLLAIAKTVENNTQRVLALRGYVRLLALPSERPVADTIARYEEALGMATGADEVKTVLGALADLKHPAALQLAGKHLDDDAVRAEAVAASLKIARAISGAYRDDAEAVVKQILDATTDANVRKQAEEALGIIQRFDDYVVAWEISGPYTQEGKGGGDLFDVAFPPEDPKAEGVTWTVMATDSYPDKPWLMGFDVVLGGTNRVAYVRTCVNVPAAQEATLELGSDDGVKVWLNGEVVHANNASRGCNPGDDKLAVQLKAGANPLMLKVTQGGGEWAACLRLRNNDGSAIEGLKASLDCLH